MEERRGIPGKIGQHHSGGETLPLLLHSCVRAKQEPYHQGQGWPDELDIDGSCREERPEMVKSK